MLIRNFYPTCQRIVVSMSGMENWCGPEDTNSNCISTWYFNVPSQTFLWRLYTDTCDLEEVPELFLSLHLHLHHSRLSCFYVCYGRLQLGEQVDNAALTHQNCTVGAADRERWGPRHARLTCTWAQPGVTVRDEITSGGCTGLSKPCLGSELSEGWPSTCPSCHCSHAEGLDLHQHMQTSQDCNYSRNHSQLLQKIHLSPKIHEYYWNTWNGRSFVM